MKTEKDKSIENISTIKNQINIQAELILRQKKLNQVKKDQLICNRDNFLQKINEIENLVLENKSEKKFFVLIPNKRRKVGLVEFKHFNSVISKFKFNSLLGKLLILNQLPDEELIKNIILIVNSEHIDAHFNDNFQDFLKCLILVQLLEMNYKKSIVDLSNVHKNGLNHLQINCRSHSMKIDDNNFEVIRDFINPDLTQKLDFSIKMKNIPNSILTIFKNVTEFYFNHSNIMNIQSSYFVPQNQLVILNVNFTNLKSIEANAFINLKNLEELNLDYNKLGEINRAMFTGLDKLKVLSMFSNEIKMVDEHTFDNLQQLVKLHLKCNRIRNIKLDKLINLEYLDLTNNSFMLDIGTDIFTKLPKLKNFNFF